MESIPQNYYDDFIDSFNSFGECMTVTRLAINILLQTSPKATIKYLNDNDAAFLWMKWDTNIDELFFKFNTTKIDEHLLIGDKIATKRNGFTHGHDVV